MALDEQQLKKIDQPTGYFSKFRKAKPTGIFGKFRREELIDITAPEVEPTEIGERIPLQPIPEEEPVGIVTEMQNKIQENIRKTEEIQQVKPVIDKIKEKKGRGLLQILYEESLKKPFSSFMAGTQQTTSNALNAVDQWVNLAAEKLGIGEVEFLKNASDFYTKSAEQFEKEGIESGLGKYLYQGIGQAAIDLPVIMSTGLPGYSAFMGGAEAIEQDENVALGVAKGLAHGLLLHKIFKTLGFAPVKIAVPTGGIVFGGESLISELQKPEGQRDYERVASDFLIGMGMTFRAGELRRRATVELPRLRPNEVKAFANKLEREFEPERVEAREAKEAEKPVVKKEVPKPEAEFEEVGKKVELEPIPKEVKPEKVIEPIKKPPVIEPAEKKVQVPPEVEKVIPEKVEVGKKVISEKPVTGIDQLKQKFLAGEITATELQSLKEKISRRAMTNLETEWRAKTKPTELYAGLPLPEPVKKFIDENISSMLGKKEIVGEIKPETLFQLLQRQLQDKFSRLKYIQRRAPKMSEKIDTYMKATLFVGRATERIRKFQRYIVDDKANSFLKRLTDKDLDIDKMGEYLYAKHAQERNLKISEINPKIEFGSGMSNAKAKEIIDKYKGTGIEKFAEEFYENVTKEALKIRLDAGLINQETYDKLTSTYKNYVPLKGHADIETYARLGKGFSITGKDIRRARGRESEADNPFTRAILDYEEAVIRAEKNKVSQTFLEFVRENPSDLWTVEKQQFMPRFNKEGEIEYLDPLRKVADNVLEVKENGKTVYITIKDKGLVEGLKNLGETKGIKFLNNFNAYLRHVTTIMSPEFVITNFQRDLQTALINIGGEQSLSVAKGTLKDIPKAMKGVYKSVREGKPNEWSKLYDELREKGGKVGWFDYKTLEQKTTDFEKKIRDYNKKGLVRQSLKETLKYVMDINEVVESAVRLSAYKQLVNAGFSKDKAAMAAKELTVNFNKKGQLGQIMNSLYLFSNASVQGTTRMFVALKNPNVRRIVTGLMVASFVQSFVNRLINEEDYDQMSDYNKDNYWLFMTPTDKTVSVKVPYGYNMFKVVGNISEEMVFGNLAWEDAVKRLLNSAQDAFNPLGGTTETFIVPTPLRPMVEMGINQNFFGGQIKPEQEPYKPYIPESQLYFKSVRRPSKAFAKWLNKQTGGNQEVSGKIDISPEMIDHLIDFFGGGLGKFLTNTFVTGESVLKTGDFPEIRNIPMLRQIIKQPSEWKANMTVYGMLRESTRTIYGNRQTENFKSALDKMFKDKTINLKKRKELWNEFNENQKSAKSSGEWTKKIMESKEHTFTDSEKTEFFEMMKSAVKEGKLSNKERLKLKSRFRKNQRALK